jgi:hypothetical protein
MKKEGDLSSTAILSTRLIFQRVNLCKQYEKQFVQISSMLCEIKLDITWIIIGWSDYFNFEARYKQSDLMWLAQLY